MEKIISYLGFAIKSNNIVYGIDNLIKYQKRLYLIIICPSCVKKSVNLAIKKANELSCDIKMTTETLQNMLHKDNCKIIGIKDESLAKAILNCKNNLVEVNIG